MLARVTVVQVRGDAEARAGIGQVAPVPSHVVEVPVEVIGGREPENRAGDEREVGVVGNAGQLQDRALGSAPAGHHSLVLQKVARPAARRHGGFDALVDSREVRRELAPHGMAVGTDARHVHFRLLFQKGDGAARGHEHEKPIAVPRRLDRVERVFIRRKRTREMVRLVALRRMRGVEFAPIGLRPVVAHRRAAEVQFVAAPVERNARIPALGISDHAVERSRLPATVHLEDGGQFRSSFWKSVEAGDSRRRSFENADLIANNLAPHPILLPLLEDFDFERALARIKARPELGERSRDLRCSGRRFQERQRQSGPRGVKEVPAGQRMEGHSLELLGASRGWL